MPPKRITRVSSTPSHRRKRVQIKTKPLVVVAASDDEEKEEDGMFASYNLVLPRFNAKKKKPKPNPKTIPDEEIEKVSSDDEDARNFHVPEANNTDEREFLKYQQQLDDFENKSISYYNDRGERLKLDKDKCVVGLHEDQPSERNRPAPREEHVGNFPPTPKNKKPKKKKKKEEKAAVPKKKVVASPPREETNYAVIAKSILENNQHITRKHLPPSTVHRSFRVFATPIRQKIYGTHLVNTSESKEHTLYSRTPIRGTGLLSPSAARLSTFSEFSPRAPQFASTPLDRPKKGRITERPPVFELSEIGGTDEDMEEEIPPSIDNFSLKTTIEPEPETAQEASEFMEDVEPEPEQTAKDGTFRKAETSMTEILVDSEAEYAEQETVNYSKKRQRTKSPETMCQGMSTMEPVELMEPMEQEKENLGTRRTTLQPQQQQLLRESRLSVLTTASSRRESLDSLLQDMSIEMGDTMCAVESTIRLESEGTTRVESRTLATGMTIRHEDPDILPWFLEDGNFDQIPSELEQLYFVCNNQKTSLKWSDLPKGVFDGRRVKKLGEGTYGEVFSTVWNGNPVAVKIVPFETDRENRMYTGEYHSDQMQVAADVLPELVVMTELSKLRDMDGHFSTPNFIEIVDAKVVEGLYPKGLLKAWDAYNEKDPDVFPFSENTRPDVYASKHQKFMVFVAENGGVALENFQLGSEHELRSILLQLMLSMQAAEEMLEFEHRDLHLGNVLVNRSSKVEKLQYKINGHRVDVHAHGVKVNIIDFTLSRISKPPTVVFMDLENDPELFEGEGDPQFDVYRQMRAFRNKEWYNFEKKTNLMWLEYLALQMIDTQICPEGVISEERREELRAIFHSFKRYDCCAATFVDEDLFNRLYKGYM